MTTATQAGEYAGTTSLYVPVDCVPLVPGPDPLPRPLRGIRAEVAGTVTVITAVGEERVMAFFDGETRYMIITHVLAATATGLEGLI